MSVIGFDIGNETCVIAAAKRGGIDVLLNDEAKRETPSVVSFGDKQRFLGSVSPTSSPKSTITQIKRLIGRLYNEPSVQQDLKLLPFVTREGPRGGILVEIDYLNEKWSFTPVEILGMLFTHLKQIAVKNLESPVVDCVIGIPSYFTDLQRREYLDAACIAGLRPLKLIHDGTAIALGYGVYKTEFSNSGPTVVVFVDIGHSDTQVTVAAFEQGGMVILSHSFDPNLGGRDFDEVLFRHFAAQFKEKYKIDVYSNTRASIRLRASCEKVKKVLSANSEAPISIECLIGDTDVRGLITRDEFEKLSQGLLERVTVPCIKAVEDSGIDVDKLYTIELVGSGSRIPAITRMLTLLFNKEPTRTLNASECVARGCALQCAMLSPTLIVRDYKVHEVFPYSIGIPADGSKKKTPKEIPLFSKGRSFPNCRMIRYRGETPIHVQLYYIDKTDFPAGLSPKVGHFTVAPSRSPGQEIVIAVINLKLNDHGIVEIESAALLENKCSSQKNASSYLDKTMGNGQITNLAFSKNMDFESSEAELHEAQQRERMLAEQDKKIEEIKDQRNTLESFVYDSRSKLSNAYRSFATNLEKEVITNSLQETEDWLYEDSDDEYEQDYTGKLKDLQKLLEPVVNRYKVEKAKAEATKYLLTCIEEYRLVADSMTSIQKKEVNNECDEAERFLTRVQNDPSTKNADPVEWSKIIKHGVELLNRSCENIMRPVFSFPIHSNQRHQPVDSNQRYQSVDVNQRDHHVDPTQRDRYVDSNHKNQHINSNHSNQPVVSNQTDQPVNSIQTGSLVDSNQTDQPVDSIQTGSLVDSNQIDQPVDSIQMGSLVDSEQTDQPVDSIQTGSLVYSNQPVDSIQTGSLVDSNQPVGSIQMGSLVDSNQRDQPVDSIHTGSLVDSAQTDQPVDSIQTGSLVDSIQTGSLVDSNQTDQPVDSIQTDSLVDSDQTDQPVDSIQTGSLVDSNQPVDLIQTGSLVDSNQTDQPVDSIQTSSLVDSNQTDQPVDSIQTGSLVDSDQRDEHDDEPDQRDKHVDSNQRIQTVDSDQNAQTVESNQKDQPEDV